MRFPVDAMITTIAARTRKHGGSASGGQGAQVTTFTAAVAIGGPIAALFACIAVLGFLFFRWVALEHDATSRAADISAMQQSLEAAVEAQKAMASEYGHWDASFENTTLRWSPEFVAETFYTDLDDTLVIASEDLTVRYGWSHPRHGADGAGRIAASLALLPGRLAREDFPVDDQQSAAAHSYLGLFGGVPLVVTVIPIHPETPELLQGAASQLPADFLIAGRTLDLPQLAAMGQKIGLSGVRFLVGADPDPSRASLAIGMPGAPPVGFVSWQDRQPGTATFNAHIGGLLGGFALLSVLAALAISRSVRSSLRASEAARLAAEAARGEAERANAAKSQFLATMSHELRTPLNAIIGYSEILVENAEDDQRQADARDAGRIVAAGHHLLSMINQILDHAAIEADAVSFSASAVDMFDTARDVVAMVGPMARASGTGVELACDGAAITALADPVRVRQCLLNVVGNAVKFTRAGTVRIDCRRTRRDGRDWALLSVSDTGIGMSPETLARLFTPFMQADGSETRSFEGTGLGLAITKRLMDGMNGQIEVASALGAGTTVSLRLPLYIDESLAAAA